jgi:hypothetical protein
VPFQTHFTLVPFEIVSFLGEKKSSFTETVFVVVAATDGSAAAPAATAAATRIGIAFVT